MMLNLETHKLVLHKLYEIFKGLICFLLVWFITGVTALLLWKIHEVLFTLGTLGLYVLGFEVVIVIYAVIYAYYSLERKSDKK